MSEYPGVAEHPKWLVRAESISTDAKGVQRALTWALLEHERALVHLMTRSEDWPRDVRPDRLVWPVPYVRIRSRTEGGYSVAIWSCPCPDHRWGDS